MRSPSDIVKLAACAGEFSVEQERLDKIILEACDDQFVACFKHASFRAWLAERPQAREKLLWEHYPALVKVQAFHDLLTSDGALAVRLLQGVAAQYARHLECCGFDDPRIEPITEFQHGTELDSETDEDDDDDSLDGHYESDQDYDEDEDERDAEFENAESDGAEVQSELGVLMEEG